MNVRPGNIFTTEIECSLLKGYLDKQGILHNRGVVRLVTALGEILPLCEPRVQQNQAHLATIVLARVITRLSDLPSVDTRVVEGLFASDLNFLQRISANKRRGDANSSTTDLVALQRETTADGELPLACRIRRGSARRVQ